MVYGINTPDADVRRFKLMRSTRAVQFSVFILNELPQESWSCLDSFLGVEWRNFMVAQPCCHLYWFLNKKSAASKWWHLCGESKSECTSTLGTLISSRSFILRFTLSLGSPLWGCLLQEKNVPNSNLLTRIIFALMSLSDWKLIECRKKSVHVDIGLRYYTGKCNVLHRCSLFYLEGYIAQCSTNRVIMNSNCDDVLFKE